MLGVSLRTLPRPDIALVHLGTKDMSGSLDSAIVEPMRDIVMLLRNANPEVKMLIAQIPAGLAQGLYLHYRIDRLAAEMSTPASPVRTVDQRTGWKPAEATFDGVHPNLVGQRWMAENWLSAIRPFLPPADNGCQSATSASTSR